jgi:hypothetical protein
MTETTPRYRLLFSFLLIFFFSLSGFVVAQTEKNVHVIRLKNVTVTPAQNARQWLDSMSHVPADKEPVQVLIHFSSVVSEKQKEELRANGISLYEYVPENTYYALMQFPLINENVLTMPIYSIINTLPEWKADDVIWRQVSGRSASVSALVSFYPGINAQDIKQFVAGMGGQIIPGPLERYGSYKVVIGANKLLPMAEWYGVRYISPLTKMVPLDLQSMPAVKGNIARGSAVYGGYGLLGDGVTVGVGDESSGIYHIDLKDRITNFNPAPNAHHGEFVNGIVGSAAIVDPLATIITPHVSLVDHLFDLILPATGSMLHDYNMTITNNSYEVIAGDCSYAGTYDAYAQLLDTLSIEYPQVLHVFASGNDGYMTCSPFPSGYATVGGGYQPAKNAIVVGSMTDYLYEASDESRGPVKDGRLKPDMIAIGLGAYSCIDLDQYEWSAGTSMAAPQVASGLAALTQRYKQLNAGVQPRADVLKTILLDGAMDLGNPGPDFSYGFGAMDLYRSLQILDSGHYFTSTIFNNETQTANILIPPNTGQVKIMLYWNDVPASPTSAVQLVNDLDLTVTDPASGQHLPLVLDPTPANVNNNATEQADHLNNTEQVTITNPPAGTYTINVKGFSVPLGPQQYVVAYDVMPKNIHLTFPIGGEQFLNIDSIRVFWDAVTDGNSFTVEFSPDNGTSWLPISNTVAADVRHCDFVATGYNSGICLVRVTRNGTADVVTSGRFAIGTLPIANLDTAQCPGYVNIHWSPVPNATKYLLLKKSGFYMQVVDSVTTDTAYSFGNMSLTEKSYVAVQPIINGIPGYRSVAVITLANSGNCTNLVSSGDLTITKIVAPVSGRMYTSTQLATVMAMQVNIRDLYNASCTNYTLSYQVNSGPWQTVTNPGAIPANDVVTIGIPGLSLPDTGVYNIVVAVHNLDRVDPQPGNDTMSFTVVSIPNDTMNLVTPFTDGFENMPKFSVDHDSIGVSSNGHWDYFNADDSGRIRSFVDEDVTITGTRSVSLDENQSVKSGSRNTFVGTFNLANYDTATSEIRVDFDYRLHGNPKSASGNLVTARGNDAAAWSPFYSYDLSVYPGSVTHVQSLSLTDVVRHSGHNFSTSTQVSFGQSDTSLISAPDYGNGTTFDNFRLYTVSNDVGLVKIVTPLANNCGLPSSAPLTVQVNNGVNYPLDNVRMFYSMDGGPVFTGTINAIPAKDTVNFTFAQQLNIAPGSTHVLSVWLTEAGDTYPANDSILNYSFRNSNIIDTFPYLENFESGDGGYFSAGIRNSWQYGTPASPKIHRAASGTKAWKTNLNGNYSNLETSYLYSPCFDISQLAHPMLSFSAAMDIENCGSTLCDQGYIEYTFDGATWSKLGVAGQGTNWYDSTFDVWNTEGFTRWHVASIPLPQPPVGQSIHFRFILKSDPGATFEGIAVDDIHIYDLYYPILPATRSVTITQNTNANLWEDYLLSNQLLASVKPMNEPINALAVALYPHDTISNPGGTQYTFPRSYTIKAPQIPADSTRIRLYLLDSEVVTVLNDTTCPSCSPIQDAYSLGITQYDNNNHNAENGSLVDDTGGVFTYYPYRSVKWVPYDKGYYAEITTKPFSEYWFNDGGPTGTFPAGVDYLNFVAFKNGEQVTTYWYSLIDTAVNIYSLQRSSDSINFTTILDTAALHNNSGQYTYNDLVNIPDSAALYYQLQWTMNGSGTIYHSPVRKVSNADSANNLVSLFAEPIGNRSALVNWTSYIDGMVDHYILDRAIETNPFTTVDNVAALNHYGQQYDFTDQPTTAISNGAPVHYRLTAFLQNGTVMVLPIRTIIWDNGNSVMNIYPNPNFDGTFTILWHADAGTELRVDIFDASGRSNYSATATATQWNNSTTFQTVNCAKGVYFIRIDIGGQRYTAKLVYE